MKKKSKNEFYGLDTLRFASHMTALEHMGYVISTLFHKILGEIPGKGSVQTQEIRREKKSAMKSVKRIKRLCEKGQASISGYATSAF